jgi:multicomponent Na+:H+ antiporter subunit D
MKITAICGIIGAMAISAFPLTSGFVSKTMIMASAKDEQLITIWLLLMAASAGVFLHAGIKFPWFVFFSHNKNLQAQDPPLNIKLAMIFMAILCIIPAVPDLTQKLLYNMLPIAVDFNAYSYKNIVTDLQLLLFSGLAFFLILPILKGTPSISLDFDFIYRKLAHYIIIACYRILKFPSRIIGIFLRRLLRKMQNTLRIVYAPGGIIERNWAIGTTGAWIMFLLGLYIIVYYVFAIYQH